MCQVFIEFLYEMITSYQRRELINCRKIWANMKLIEEFGEIRTNNEYGQ